MMMLLLYPPPAHLQKYGFHLLLLNCIRHALLYVYVAVLNTTTDCILYHVRQQTTPEGLVEVQF